MVNSDKNSLKIGVALSGGGFRAAVFHLGILARLANDDLLENITYISTVSGGSLVTGLIYSLSDNTWPDSKKFLTDVYPQARKYLTTINIQLDSLLRLLTRPHFAFQGKSKLISESITKRWGVKGTIPDLPKHPRWDINSTTYQTGNNWRFKHDYMGDYIINYTANHNTLISDAIAASAAFPGLIGPLKLKTKKYKWFKFLENTGETQELERNILDSLHLWDGGVYDNLGVEALYNPQKPNYRKEYNFLVVSDASKGLEIEKSRIFYKSAFRLLDIAMDQVRSLRARQLATHFIENENSGAYFKIGDSAGKIVKIWKKKEQETPIINGDVLSKEDVNKAGHFPTKLKSLSTNDFDLIARHGWEVANYTLLTICPSIFAHKTWED